MTDDDHHPSRGALSAGQPVIGPAEQLRFVRVLRPLASVFAVACFGVVYLVSRSDDVRWVLAVAAASLVYALACRVAQPVIGTVPVIGALAIGDALMIVALAAGVGAHTEVALIYLWAIGSAALFASRRVAIATTAICVAGTVGVPLVAGERVAIGAIQAVVLTLVGWLLLRLSALVSRARTALDEERLHDDLILHVAHRAHDGLDERPVFEDVARRLGAQLHLSRCSIRIFAEGDAPADELYEWHDDAYGPGPARAPIDRELLRRSRELGYLLARTDEVDEPLRTHLRAAGSESSLGSVMWRQGRPIGIFALHSDVERTWNAEEIALVRRITPVLSALALAAMAMRGHRELAAQREQLVARVSHELRTPLTATLGFLQTAQRDDVQIADEERWRLVGLAERGATTLQALVADLADLALMQRGEVRLRVEPVDLLELATGTLEQLPDVGERSIRIDGEEQLLVIADPQRVQQVLTNLITNAVHHGQGEVRVTCRRTTRGARIEVSDAGDGVPYEVVERLFQPFSTFGSHPLSTGLGLAISRGIAQSHNGTLTYEPASGAESHRFVLELPYDPDRGLADGEDGDSLVRAPGRTAGPTQ